MVGWSDDGRMVGWSDDGQTMVGRWSDDGRMVGFRLCTSPGSPPYNAKGEPATFNGKRLQGPPWLRKRAAGGKNVVLPNNTLKYPDGGMPPLAFHCGKTTMFEKGGHRTVVASTIPRCHRCLFESGVCF